MNKILEAILPMWVITVLKDWYLKKRSGEITLCYSDGGVRAIKRNDRIEPPKKK